MRILGVLAGNDVDSETLKAWVLSADVVFAADGGADSLLDLGLLPSATIGDLDSISNSAREAQTDLYPEPDQNSTDCDKLLALAASRGYQEITLIGVEGDLPDHVLGILQSAARASLAVRLAYRRGLGWILRGPCRFQEPLSPPGARGRDEGRRVSLVPIVRCEGVAFRGVHWPLENAILDPMGLTSLSNRSEGDRVEVEIESGVALLFLETGGEPLWEPPSPQLDP